MTARPPDERGSCFRSYIYRWLSPDSIIPNPANPQSYNRFSYVRNNPVRWNDPSGHCANDDTECWALADELYEQYGWYLAGLGSHGRWTLEEVEILQRAAMQIELWFARLGGGDYRGRMRSALGEVGFVKGGILSDEIFGGRHHVRGNTVHLVEGEGLSAYWVVHEVGHVLDNRLGPPIPIGAALFGGGPADDMARALGGELCMPRSGCSGYQTPLEELRGGYATEGPSEDFAEAFRQSVRNPGEFAVTYEKRAAFMADLGRSLTTSVGEFQGSPYSNLPHGVASYGGGGPGSVSHLLR